jgi:pantoate--beta-alanine ligase
VARFSRRVVTINHPPGKILPVQQLLTIDDQRTFSKAAMLAGKRIGFVPTMGALHAGHISLIARARAVCDVVVVSIFVNPTQFDNPEDFSAYPITLEDDLEQLREAGVDAVFTPTKEEMYPNGYCTFVEMVGPLTDKLCGVARPGHFRGVTTIVSKLFHIVQPNVAVFGEKDLQQVLIISRMVKDLDMPIEIIIGKTLREDDGLVMSSRNRRLDEVGRAKALALPRSLEMARLSYQGGESNANKLCEEVYGELLLQDGVAVDYCEVISLKGFTEKEVADDSCFIAAAAFVDGVRLIDHVHLAGPEIVESLDD